MSLVTVLPSITSIEACSSHDRVFDEFSLSLSLTLSLPTVLYLIEKGLAAQQDLVRLNLERLGQLDAIDRQVLLLGHEHHTALEPLLA